MTNPPEAVFPPRNPAADQAIAVSDEKISDAAIASGLHLTRLLYFLIRIPILCIVRSSPRVGVNLLRRIQLTALA